MNITYDQWVQDYQPELNTLNNSAPYDGLMFETFGYEEDYVRSILAEPNGGLFVWTLMDGDGVDAIVSGFHWVNRLGYFVTKVPVIGDVTVEWEETL